MDFENLKDSFEAKSSKDWSKIDGIAKRSYNKPDKESENERCKSFVCCISKNDFNINWIECAKCLNWVHCLCEGIFSRVLLFQIMLTFNVCVVSHILLKIPLRITLLPSQKKIVKVKAN